MKHNKTHTLPAETCPAVETATSITDTFPFTSQDAKQTLKSRKKRRPKRSITSKIDTQLTPHKPKKYTFTGYIRRRHAYIRRCRRGGITTKTNSRE
ncbi:hypothetical protein TNCV_318191 [Trichonephila clavipes]|nr:hypothetical protein TNCV_318191 [Trichonephila clavipes]